MTDIDTSPEAVETKASEWEARGYVTTAAMLRALSARATAAEAALAEATSLIEELAPCAVARDRAEARVRELEGQHGR